MTVALNIKEAVVYGVETFRSRLGLFLFPTLVYAGVLEGMSLGLDRLADLESPMIVPALFLYLLLVFFLSLGFIKVALKVFDGQAVGMGDFLRWNPEGGRFMVVSLLLAIVTGFGMSFFLLPGLILATLLGFAMWLVVDREAGGVDALARSFALTHGNRMRILWLGLIFTIPTALGAYLAEVHMAGHLASLLLVALSTPIYWLSSTYVYRKLVEAA